MPLHYVTFPRPCRTQAGVATNSADNKLLNFAQFWPVRIRNMKKTLTRGYGIHEIHVLLPFSKRSGTQNLVLRKENRTEAPFASRNNRAPKQPEVSVVIDFA